MSGPQSVVKAFKGETDEDGRILIRMGGDCPACGKPAEVKYAGTGNLVMYHIPAECQQHARWHHQKKSGREEFVPPVPYKESA